MSEFTRFWKKEIRKSVRPKLFSMIRNGDESGVSGTGRVLDGVIFPSGKVVVCWDPDNSNVKIEGENVNSISTFDSFDAFTAIHIGQHPTNGTEIRFLN